MARASISTTASSLSSLPICPDTINPRGPKGAKWWRLPQRAHPANATARDPATRGVRTPDPDWLSLDPLDTDQAQWAQDDDACKKENERPYTRTVPSPLAQNPLWAMGQAGQGKDPKLRAHDSAKLKDVLADVYRDDPPGPMEHQQVRVGGDPGLPGRKSRGDQGRPGSDGKGMAVTAEHRSGREGPADLALRSLAAW